MKVGGGAAGRYARRKRRSGSEERVSHYTAWGTTGASGLCVCVCVCQHVTYSIFLNESLRRTNWYQSLHRVVPFIQFLLTGFAITDRNIKTCKSNTVSTHAVQPGLALTLCQPSVVNCLLWTVRVSTPVLLEFYDFFKYYRNKWLNAVQLRLFPSWNTEISITPCTFSSK